MRHNYLPSRILYLFFVLLLIFVGASSVSRAEAASSLQTADPNSLEFQLVSPEAGWVLMGSQLHWTEDNGLTWQEITPPVAGNQIMDVVFLDDRNAWVVAGQNGTAPFVLASSSDRGQSWSLTTHDFSELSQFPSAVAGAHMGWRDPSNGWLVFEFATGSNFSVGFLYTTRDGGSTWDAHDIPLGEPAHFVDAQNGWVAGGPAGRLFYTQDGGATWQEQAPASNAYYHLPIFAEDRKAILPVVLMEENAPQMEFFRTDDTGRTWTSTGRLALEPDTPFDISLPLAFADDGTGTLVVPSSDRIVRLVDGQLSEFQNEDGLSANIVALDMASSESGWGKWMTGTCDTTGKETENLSCTRETRLLRTRDGGSHWESISLPGTGQTSMQDQFSLSGDTGDRFVPRTSAIPDPDTQPYVGQGFDKCEVPTLTQLQKWWTSSPYNAVNLYIGGSARGCSNAALSASFLAQANSQGWRFIPTWVGPQASCTGYLSRMSSNAAVAYDQGVAEADSAVNTAVSLGLAEPDGSGTIIYYDLEAYSTSNTSCRNAANAFISGWVAEMRARGNLGGVYGASCASAITDWASIANVPDAIWIANWYGNAGTVSYRPTASVWSAACLSDSLWSNHARLRQYAGGHNETWGGLTLNIDSNVLDGPLTARNGTAGAAPSQPLNLGPVPGSTLERSTDTWLTWKTTGNTCSVHVWGGSIDTTVNGNCSFYRLGVRPGGSYSWQVTAMNNYGNTVSPVWQFKIKPYSPVNLAITSVASTTMNLSWQLSADEPSNVDAYDIYRDGTHIASVNKGSSNYQATNLACNSAYSFYVKAVRQGVESDASNTVSGTTTTCAPPLVSPGDGVVLENRRPSFEWQAVDVAISYQIQVSLYEDFSSRAIDVSTAETAFHTQTNLVSDRIYYWRVRSIGPLGNGDWSAVRSFRTANPPSLPLLSSPANGGLTTNYQPKLNWTDSALPAGTRLDHYRVQVASDSLFSTILYDQSTTASEFVIPADLLPNKKYYWHVQAFNTLGQYTWWTATWSFRTAVLPPILSSPSDGFTFNYRRPTLDWSDVSDATRYTLQVSRYQNFSTVLLTRVSALSQYVSTADLPGNTLLYWRVRTEAVNGPSKWSEVWKFKTGNPPGIPALLTPTNNVLITNYRPRLDWANVTVPVGTSLDHYQIQAATDLGFDGSTIVRDQNVNASEYVPDTPLAPNAKYYWRVRSFNTNGHYSSWSLVRYFRAALRAPVPITPEDASSPTSLHPIFNWQSVDGATSYTIQISRYRDFSTYLVGVSISSPTYTPAANLPRGIDLYWRVRANGPNGPSPWSTVFQFQIP